MSRPAAFALLLLLAALAGPAVGVADDDAAPRPAPPAIAVEPARAIADDLASGAVARRERAQAALAEADADLLRAVIAELLRQQAPAAGETPTLLDDPSAAARDATQGGPLVRFETSIVRATPEGLKQLLALGTPDARGLRRYDRALLHACIEAGVKSEPGPVALMTAPRVTAFEFQETNISVLRQTAFVQDYDVEVGMGGAFIADPVIGTLQEGVTLKLKAHRLGEELWVDAHLDLAEVMRPIAEASIRLGDASGAAPVRIQLPEVRTTRWERTSLLPPDVPVLLAQLTPAVSGEAECVLVFLEAKVVEHPGAAPADGK